MAGRFEGRSAIVTGAGSGIGREIAGMLLADGAWVLAADRDPGNAPDGAEQRLSLIHI